MNYSRSCTLLIVAVLLSSCGLMERNSQSDSESESAGSNESELTGMLVVVNPENCPLVDGCGPQFSLLGRKLETRIALTGEIQPEHENLILSVVGPTSPLASELEGKSGYDQVSATVAVEKYRVRSSIPYYPFLVEQATLVTEATYGCDLLWDKSYSWTIENAIPLLTVRMTNTFADAPQPWVELTFNGDTGELVSDSTSSDSLSPCDG